MENATTENKKSVSRPGLITKIKSNRLISITVFLGIFGVVLPFLIWLLNVNNPIQNQDLEKLRDDLRNIEKISQDIQKAVERIINTADTNGLIRDWKLNEYEREILKKLSHGQRQHITAIFSFFLFSLQGSFFVLLGIILERKWISPRQNKLTLTQSPTSNNPVN